MPDNLTVLGFDPGSHWIGSAVGQTRTCTASPLEPIRSKQFKPDWEHIARLIETWKPDLLIVGLPTTMDGKAHKMTEQAQAFSRKLQGRFNIPTELVDERLTTRAAWQIVEEQSGQRQGKPDIDCIAAVLITETWLNERQPGSG
jgi:putative Holliday junction resolvase